MSDKGSVGAARGYRERNPRPWCDATMDTDELQYVCDRLPGHVGPHRDQDMAEWFGIATGEPPSIPMDEYGNCLACGSYAHGYVGTAR